MKLLALSLFICILASFASAGEPDPRQFAYGTPLAVNGRGAFYEFSIPSEVYRVVTSGDLGDVCIFNSMNEIVPFTISRAVTPRSTPEESLPLPFFPLSQNPERMKSGMSLRIRKATNGSIISVDAMDEGRDKRRVTSYLIDASALKRPFRAIELRWLEQPAGAVYGIRVEGSKDLERWTTLLPKSTVMDIRYGEHALQRRILETGDSRARYLRLTPTDVGNLPRITSVSARIASPLPERTRQWVEARSVDHNQQTGEYTFDIEGKMPVDRVRIVLPQENTLATATLLSRDGKGEPWRKSASALVYRLRVSGKEVFGPDLSLPPTPRRYWMLRIDQVGGGIGRGIPEIRFGWIPDRIVFAARGTGPFLMAYGSAKAKARHHGSDNLFRGLSNERPEGIVIDAALPGVVVTLGGELALKKPFLPTDMKTASLWAVLLLGVAFLGWMSVRIHRRMKTDAGVGNTEDPPVSEKDHSAE